MQLNKLEENKHEWYTYDFMKYECCRKCGIIRRSDDKNNPCKNEMALRDSEGNKYV